MNTPVNRLEKYWSRMGDKPSSKTTAGDLIIDQDVADAITQAIADSSFVGDGELSKAAGCDRTSVFKLRSYGCASKGKVLLKVCAVLGIDPDEALAGRIVYVDESQHIPDIVTLAKQLKGTEDERAFRVLMHNAVSRSNQRKT